MAVPMALLRAFAQQIPRLQAEETLLASQASAIGSGAMKQRDVQAAIARLQRVAAGGNPYTKLRNKTDLGAVAAMGVGVRIVVPTHGD